MDIPITPKTSISVPPIAVPLCNSKGISDLQQGQGNNIPADLNSIFFSINTLITILPVSACFFNRTSHSAADICILAINLTCSNVMIYR